MEYLTYTVLWVAPSILLAVGIGYHLGRMLGKQERESTLKALLVLLQSTEQLSNDMDTRNTELADVGRRVKEMSRTSELGDVQDVLLGQIMQVIKSNKRLESDLVCARYTLEHQAQELDRTGQEARVDVLSGVENRKAFDETFHYWVSNAKRNEERFALVLTDIDHFKWINDTHGHRAGDRVVTGVGALLHECLRGEDYAARYGGDEFAILLKTDDTDSAYRVADRIRAAAETRNYNVGIRSERVAVTFSMGLALFLDEDTPESLLEKADQALYKAKQSGRNCLKVHEAKVEQGGDDADGDDAGTICGAARAVGPLAASLDESTESD